MGRNREYNTEWKRRNYAKNRAEFFKDKICVDCGSKESLELDHINPEDKTSHNIWNWSEERRQIELAKCAVRCHDCHMLKHHGPLVHGTYSGYRRKCRCQKCKDAWAERARTQWLSHGTISRYVQGCRCDECTAEHERKPIAHGTPNGYSTRRCRCDECKAAKAQYDRQRKANVNLSEVPHGTDRGYTRGCKCQDCLDAHAAYCRERQAIRKRTLGAA